MNFVPAIPVMQQQTQGMNYGNWQQYAGFGKGKTFRHIAYAVLPFKRVLYFVKQNVTVRL